MSYIIAGERLDDSECLFCTTEVRRCCAELMEGPPEKRRRIRSDLAVPLPHVVTRTLKVASQPSSPRTDVPRAVRPRPLHVLDKVRAGSMHPGCCHISNSHALCSGCFLQNLMVRGTLVCKLTGLAAVA